jgi:hypothetical protein
MQVGPNTTLKIGCLCLKQKISELSRIAKLSEAGASLNQKKDHVREVKDERRVEGKLIVKGEGERGLNFTWEILQKKEEEPKRTCVYPKHEELLDLRKEYKQRSVDTKRPY